MEGKTLRRYQEAREHIDAYSDRIYALAKMLELADHLDPLEPKLDPQAVAQVGKMMARDICQLISCLDDFAGREG